MSIVDETEAELKQEPIDCGCHIERIVRCGFHAKSSERLAALCRYVRAVEWIYDNGCLEPTAALQSARAELGLGKE